MSIRVAILGYGNLGRGMECAEKQNSDMELVAVFTRRDPKYSEDFNRCKGIQCRSVTVHAGPDRCTGIVRRFQTDLPKQTAEYAKYFNVVDSFDTHAKIPSILHR